jgi:hypothetical protein
VFFSVVAIDRPSTEDAHTLVDTNDSVTVGETDEYGNPHLPAGLFILKAWIASESLVLSKQHKKECSKANRQKVSA